MTNFLTRARQGLVNTFQTDPNINRVRGWVGPVSRRLPSATAEYLAEKLPIAQWLPHYNYRWVVQDAIAGITVGVMLIPQGKPVLKLLALLGLGGEGMGHLADRQLYLHTHRPGVRQDCQY